jgi:hypothetical protein
MYFVKRSERFWTPKRQVTHIFLPTFTTALVFSVVCMIGGIENLFYKMLDPTSA